MAKNSGEALNQRALMNLMNEVITNINGWNNGALAPVALGAGSPDTALEVDADFDYMINGVAYNFTRDDDSGPVPEVVAFTATDHDIVHNSVTPREVVYLVTIDDEGAFDVVMGDIVDIHNEGDAAEVPATPAGTARVGYVRIQVDEDTTFDATTTQLDASGLTVTYVEGSGASTMELFEEEA